MSKSDMEARMAHSEKVAEEHEFYMRAKNNYAARQSHGRRAERFKELELKNFPSRNFGEDQDDDHTLWFTSNRLTYLGITGLTQDVGLAIDSAEEVIVALVARFPSCKGLDIGQELTSDATLGTIIKMGVKTIFHNMDAFMTKS
ncbi:Uu.00g051430.m01.CDS01 [Anthostomella pinea]|uniref:Uu.00g051430.m01.CDS01 n=1 Tax=Anthostomella pinea TaxID=933095 RepID=A0AAI8VSU7_9PEZI|nr:Uu.00g051430.m01.CDS01 [Anthostomella pinea]